MKAIVLLLIRGYQLLLSPMLPPVCRYWPSCSRYAAEAVERYGVLQGGWLALKRLLRCHPLRAGGIDPVPRREGARPMRLRIGAGTGGGRRRPFGRERARYRDDPPEAAWT